MATYVVSDLHGLYDVFQRGLKEISFKDEDFLYVIGDAIDHGRGGIRILLDIMSNWNMDLIIGNHEFMMLNAVDPLGKPSCTGNDTSLWLDSNGGKITFSQYELLSETERNSLLSWMTTRSVIKTLVIGEKDYCLTHSFYKKSRENVPYHDLSYAETWCITWSSIWRDDPLTHALDIYKNYPYTFITGHVPVQRVRRWYERESDWNTLKSVRRDNLIDIDGGCATGKNDEIENGAIFLRLDDLEEYAIPIL